MRRALLEVDGVELDVIAPDSNRSATARSITTRVPLSAKEIDFGDGTKGFATNGTPVDCVRFADLGLLDGNRPEMIVSGINHGANLGDDITYSGTVAAALEGIVLGIPAIAVSQQSAKREMGFRYGRIFDFDTCARFTADLVRSLLGGGIAEGTLVNINCPAGTPGGVDITRLGKRIYNDELRLIEEDSEDGTRLFDIYGIEPSFHDEEGTDLSAIAGRRISVTPLHFDLTHQPGLEQLQEWKLDEMLESVLTTVSEGTTEG